MTKLFMIIVAFFFVTLAVVTAIETISSPKSSPVLVGTVGGKNKKGKK
jgi:hypothetical protein